MRSREIVDIFLKYFEENKHKRIKSHSLIPEDSTVLFTTAGMQQFSKYLSGEVNPTFKRACSNQKCIRTSDIDEVGDASHLTFFEMLGNWSFGDYFKKEAICFALDFLEKKLGLDKKNFAITIFEGNREIKKDEETEKLWINEGILKDKIFYFGMSDNFWGPVGTSGPCGPCSEIHYDLTNESCSKGSKCLPNCKCGRYLEIWNLVFMEYNKTKEGSYKLSNKKSIDTGMGLERVSMIVQRKNNIFEIDSFNEVIKELEKVSNRTYETNKKSFRIILDHLRTSIFLISEGIKPSKEDRGYVLRRLLRSIIRNSSNLGFKEYGIKKLIDKIITIYGPAYPELNRNKRKIINVINEEKLKFEKTLDKGLKIFDKLVSENKDSISGKESFKLYDTYGFPFEITKELANEKGLKISNKEFQIEFDKHKEISKKGMVKKFGGHGLIFDNGELKAANKEELKKVIKLHTTTHLLHQALRKVLGKDVQQRGSDITSERLRFDFNYKRKLNNEQLERLESEVNNVIKQDLPVIFKETTYECAIKEKALAFFKGKYPDKVKVYYIGNYSKEICGGPHVKRTGELGKFKILKEKSSSSGIRRIKAILE